MEKNQTFANATLEQKTLILSYLMEEKKHISLYFHEQDAHPYFKEKYPEEYKYHLVNRSQGTIGLLCGIQKIDNGCMVVLKKEHWRNDSSSYDSSCIQTWTCPAHPKGMEMEIPVSLLENIFLWNL